MICLSAIAVTVQLILCTLIAKIPEIAYVKSNAIATTRVKSFEFFGLFIANEIYLSV